MKMLHVPKVRVERVVVILLHASSYDQDDFVYRFRLGVLPSNTMAALNTLTQQALHELLPDEVRQEVHVFEDGVQEHMERLRRLADQFPAAGTKLIVGLVGVQTVQFPRACDLIAEWQRRGATCLIGGFHVSGSISTLHDGIHDAQRKDVPCPHIMPPEIQSLMDNGVVVFHGEAEMVLKTMLADVLAGRPLPLYRGGQPALDEALLPMYPTNYWEHSFASEMATFDTGRGCPFTCSFCTIINVQGRRSRYRDPAAIVKRVRELCVRQGGQAAFFFTDDNFVRNPHWEEVLDGLISLREQEKLEPRFMIEADLACGKVPRFLEKLSQAGCHQIFMGVESMNPENLAEATKFQNKVDHYQKLWEECHRLGMAVHAGYIIGFSHDTPQSVPEDVAKLQATGADLVSFFILTPLPGSEDHVRLYMRDLNQGRASMDTDFNRYDSFQPVMDHPRMTRAEWLATYAAAWRQFYTVPIMAAALKRFPTWKARRALLKAFLWYRWSVMVERAHPMVSGFLRVRPYAERRPGAPYLPYWKYAFQEVWRHLRYLGCSLVEFYKFQQVIFEVSDGGMTRRWLNRFWRDYAGKRWKLLNPFQTAWWHIKMLPHAAAEVVYTLRFASLLARIVRS